MYSQDTQRKSSKGSVQVKNSNGRLQLVFSYAGKRHYLSLGLPENKETLKAAEAKAKLIEFDIIYDRFDETLAKYKPQSALSTVTPIFTPISELSLNILWQRYTEFKRPSISPNTLVKEFATVERCIEKHLPTTSLDDAVIIRDWIIANKSPDAAKRLLTQLAACCEWAVKSSFVSKNPFAGMALEVRLPKNQSNNGVKEIDSFTVEERDSIIQAFESNRYYRGYAPFVGFLFATGCRPSEAIALEWKHITKDLRLINFEQSAIISEDGIISRKGLKTQESRKFPCNSKLQNLLESIKPDDCQPNALVFPSPEGKLIDFHNFRNRAWKNVLESLPLIRYRKPYQTRHTFITLALENGMTVQDVARVSGNSPGIIYKHYASNRRQLFVPEF